MKSIVAIVAGMLLVAVVCGCSNNGVVTDTAPAIPPSQGDGAGAPGIEAPVIEAPGIGAPGIEAPGMHDKKELPEFSDMGDNPQDRIGNIVSGGGGYIAEHGGEFYFANKDDENKLYQMGTNFENKKKLSDMPNFSPRIAISIVGDNIYYTQNSRLTDEEIAKKQTDIIWTKTLYLYNLVDDTEMKVLDDNIWSYTIHGDRIYYSSQVTTGIYSAKLDGSDVQTLSEGSIMTPGALQVYGDCLYFGSDEALVCMNLDRSAFESWPAYPTALLIYKNNAYFSNYIDRGLAKFNIENGNNKGGPDFIRLAENVLSFTISEDVIYFTTHDNSLYKMDLDGNNAEYIAAGSAPVVLGNYLFYFDMDDEMDCVMK